MTRQVELTERQMQVLACLILGNKSSVIANMIGITEKAVKHHLTNIYARTKCKSDRELIAKYYLKKIKVVQSSVKGVTQ